MPEVKYGHFSVASVEVVTIGHNLVAIALRSRKLVVDST
jgi:hypothetical protein